MDGEAVSDGSVSNCYRCQQLSCNSFCLSPDAQGCVFQIGLIQSWLVSRKQVPDIATAVAIITNHGNRQVTRSQLGVTELLLMNRRRDVDSQYCLDLWRSWLKLDLETVPGLHSDCLLGFFTIQIGVYFVRGLPRFHNWVSTVVLTGLRLAQCHWQH